MGIVLFAWELGEGMGHVSRLLPVAEALAEQGHTCVFAVRNLLLASKAIRDRGFFVVQAPYAILPIGRLPFRIGAYGDIMGMVGFDEAQRLDALVHGWQAVLDMFRPDLVVGDYCPVLALTLYGSGTPLMILGDGFTLPLPKGETFPSFPGRTASLKEEQLLASIAAVQNGRGRPIPPTLPGVFAEAEGLVVTLPELDLYGEDRGEAAMGPLAPLPPPAARSPIRTWFAYLTAEHAQTSIILTTLSQLDTDGCAFVRDILPNERERLRKLGVNILDTPGDLTRIVPESAMVVHHGGLGTIEMALAMGRPQLLVPRQLEQTLNAGLVGQFGVALGLSGTLKAENVHSAYSRMLDDSSFAASATLFAHGLTMREPGGSLDRVVQRALNHLSGG